MLTEQQQRDYQSDGFLVIPNFIEKNTLNALRQRAMQIVADFDPAESVTIFTTDEQSRHSDDYFLTSQDKVRCFFEEGAFDAHGQLNREVSSAINKIGHALHTQEPLFRTLAEDPRLSAILSDVGLAKPEVIQSMYIFKQPYIGGEVSWHQDATFLYTDPVSVTGLWFAIEDATLENGCLWASPGGHKQSLKKQFRRNDNGVGTHMHTLDQSEWVEPREAQPLEVAAGTLVLLHGLLPHKSDTNTSEKTRHAFTLHAIDQTAHYPEWNWIRRDARD